MVNLKGIHLFASTLEELHEVAARFVISKSWYSSEPSPHYEIVNPHKAEEIIKYLEKHK